MALNGLQQMLWIESGLSACHYFFSSESRQQQIREEGLEQGSGQQMVKHVHLVMWGFGRGMRVGNWLLLSVCVA